jgi:amino acid transporter
VSDERSGLHRAIGPKLLLFLVIGDILGTGIYALTGDVAGAVGGAAWLSFGVAFFVALCTATSYAELVGKYPRAAGAAHDTPRAVARPIGTLLGAFSVVWAGLTAGGAGTRSVAGLIEEFATR